MLNLHEYIDQAPQKFNSLSKFIPYTPAYYNYISKYHQKSVSLELKSEEFLPTLMVNEKLQHKIKYHRQFKQAFGLTNLLQFETTITLDLISYDFEDGYSRYVDVENDELYPILLNFSADANSPIVLETLCQHFEMQANPYNSNNIELLYLNLFRIALITHKDSKLTTYLRYPSLNFHLQEIRHTNKFVETPLTKVITKSRQQSSQKKDKAQYKFGFLSLDQSNRIFPIMSQDPLSTQLPLIGAWLYSNDPYDEPLQNRHLIWSMLAEFITSPYIKQRICKDNQDQFLFIQFQKNQSPQFFEVKVQEDPSYKLVRKQEKVMNLDNHMVDLASAMPISHIEKASDLLSSTIKSFVEQSFHQESIIKQPPIPQAKDPVISQDSNMSYSSAHFANQSMKSEIQKDLSKDLNQSNITERLVIMQSEQLKLMQSQILDLQRALLQQYLPGPQQMMNPMLFQQLGIDPRQSNHYFGMAQQSPQKSIIEHTFQQQHLSAQQAQLQQFQLAQQQFLQQNQLMQQQIKQSQFLQQPTTQSIQPMVSKLDFLGEQYKTQMKQKSRQCDDASQMFSSRNSLAKVSSSEQSSHSKNYIQNTSSQEKKRSIHDLLHTSRDSGYKHISRLKETSEPDPKFTIKENDVRMMLRETKTAEAAAKFETAQKYESPKEHKKEAPVTKQSAKQSLKESSVSTKAEDNKENKNSGNIIQVSNILEQSAGSRMLPKIKFNINDCDDSDSDAEIKKLERKYLLRR